MRQCPVGKTAPSTEGGLLCKGALKDLQVLALFAKPAYKGKLLLFPFEKASFLRWVIICPAVP